MGICTQLSLCVVRVKYRVNSTKEQELIVLLAYFSNTHAHTYAHAHTHTHTHTERERERERERELQLSKSE